jgi:hypothetical protein
MILVVIQRVQGELETMCLKPYYEHAKGPFSVLEGHSHASLARAVDGPRGDPDYVS